MLLSKRQHIPIAHSDHFVAKSKFSVTFFFFFLSVLFHEPTSCTVVVLAAVALHLRTLWNQARFSKHSARSCFTSISIKSITLLFETHHVAVGWAFSLPLHRQWAYMYVGCFHLRATVLECFPLFFKIASSQKKGTHFHLAGSTVHFLSEMLRIGSTLPDPNRFSFLWAQRDGWYLLILAFGTYPKIAAFICLRTTNDARLFVATFGFPTAIWLVFQRFPSSLSDPQRLCGKTWFRNSLKRCMLGLR